MEAQALDRAAGEGLEIREKKNSATLNDPRWRGAPVVCEPPGWTHRVRDEVRMCAVWHRLRETFAVLPLQAGARKCPACNVLSVTHSPPCLLLTVSTTQVVYCGPSCQKAHWKAGHKAVCSSTSGVPSSQPDASTRVRPGMEGQEHAPASEVSLYVYDLSRGFAKRMSQMLLGKQVDGVWHTGVVVYGKEFFYGGGIQSGESWGVWRYSCIKKIAPGH